MKKPILAGLALMLGAFSLVSSQAETATSLSSFGGIEEPVRIYNPDSDSFTNDSFINITDQGGGRFRMFLRFRAGDWWDADRDTGSEDRQRAEVKVLGPRQRHGETFEYGSTWRTSSNMIAGGRFCHITQVKGYGGGDIGAPLVTTSLKTGNRVAVEFHSGSGDGTARTWSWAPNTWTRSVVRLKVSTGNDGLLLASVNGDSFTGTTGRSFYRPDAPEYQPKWGLYRGCDNNQPFGDNYLEHENVTSIEGTSNPAPIVSTPAFSPGGGTFTSAQSVTITSATSGASIRYTIDGSTPTATTGTVYSAPVSIASTTTLRAIAYKSGSTDSSVATATYTITAAQTAAPTFSPAGGTFTSAQSVTISSATSGASIRYTTDGSTPSATVGTVYSGPVTVSATTTLRAIAYASGLTDSSVSSATYTINISTGTVWEAESLTRTTSGPSATNDSDGSASGGSRVTLNSTATGSWIQFTLPNVPAGTYSIQLAYKSNNNRGIATFQVDGATVGSTLNQYASSSSYPTATIGTVTFATTGNHTFRMTVSGKASASSSYTLSADKITLVAASAAVATPTFSPGGGTFTSAQSVTISSTTSGAAIRYTTDGSTPSATVGTVYSGPVTVSATTTLRAIAYASGMTDSNVASATYTITTTPPPTLTWEAESLTRTTSGTSATNDSDGSASGGSRVTLNSTSTGSWMQFTLPNVPAGTYSIQLAYKTNGNRGIATFQVDGATVGTSLNQYASSSSYPTATIGTVTIATTGNHTFRMTVSGKASASSSYTLSADKITLVGQ